MQKEYLATLQTLGLSATEAQVYLTLAFASMPVRAKELAAAAGVPRASVYPMLSALIDKGIVRNGAGYGSEFAALPPREALARLIAAEKEKLGQAESLTANLIKEIESKISDKERISEANLIEIIRDPRVLADRFKKLQRETKREIHQFIKAPMIVKTKQAEGNPEETENLRRGVKYRVLYESTVLSHELVRPHLEQWIEAGEEAREYKGNLPFKLAIFDGEVVWLPLQTGATRHPVVSVFIRHVVLAQGLRLLFDYLWKESEPIKPGRGRVPEVAADRISRSKK